MEVIWDQEKLAGLAAIAKDITSLPVAEQFRILGKAGLKLHDINWENRETHPGMERNIPTTQDRPRVG